MKRLRPAMTAEQLDSTYGHRYDHTIWHEHKQRIGRTIDFAHRYLPEIRSVADLSCGDGVLAQSLVGDPILGDYTEGWAYHGPIETTIHEIPPVDLFVNSETLEHLDDPEGVLAEIRTAASRLLLSTPQDETINNPEHYWAWGAADIATLLERTGWNPIAFETVECSPVIKFQLWAAR